MFDRNGDGFISKAEFKHCMMHFGEQFTDEEVEEMISEADSNDDGRIDYNEFSQMILKEIRLERFLRKATSKVHNTQTLVRLGWSLRRRVTWWRWIGKPSKMIWQWRRRRRRQIRANFHWFFYIPFKVDDIPTKRFNFHTEKILYCRWPFTHLIYS